ncbi:MAG: hypothetical protein IPK83_06245 [Planctomycetes bacterium]|nr:hypothetical protein [Planctomycetota bacterium]
MPKKRKSTAIESALEPLIGHEVVLDTAGPITYLGTLREIRPEGYWLENADIRDRTEGHVSKEVYIREARLHGIQSNRQSIFVFESTVISCSALVDVIAD